MVTLAKPPTRKQLEVIAGGDQELIRALEKLFQQALNLTPTEFSQLQEQVAQDTSAILANTNAISDLSDGTVGIAPDLLAGWKVGGAPITASGVEINRLVGVTSAIQAQIDGKVPLNNTVSASATGSNVNFTVPSTARQISISFLSVSLTGFDDVLVQVGTGGVAETSGYLSTATRITTGVATTSSGAGFHLPIGSPTSIFGGVMTLAANNASGTAWTSSSNVRIFTTAMASQGGASGALSGALDLVRITTSGSDTFDNGTVAVSWS